MSATAQLKQKMSNKELATASRQVAKDAGIGTVKQFFESQRGSMAAVLPKHVSTDRMLKIALGAMRTTPKLMNCRIESLMSAVVQCAQLGLEPNTPLGHAYLIPFENRKQGTTEVQVIMGYKGLIDLARRSGQIVSIAAHEVREHDEFDFAYGLEERLEHRPASGARGEVTHFYAVAKLVGGGHAFEVMGKADIDAIRDATQSKGRFGPWKDHYVEMGRKTALRRLFKYLPVSIEMATASQIDEQQDPDYSEVLEGEIFASESIEDQEADQRGRLDNVDRETGEVKA